MMPPAPARCPLRDACLLDWTLLLASSVDRRSRKVHGLTARGPRGHHGTPLRCHGTHLRYHRTHLRLSRPRGDRAARLQRRMFRQHHDLGADIDAAEEIADVLIGQATAAPHDALADGPAPIAPVNAAP